MKWLTHQTGAVVLAAGLNFPLTGVIVAAAGAVLPDVIDQRVSKLGASRERRRKIFNKIHRGHSHWFGWWLTAFCLAACYIPPGLLRDAALGVALGALSHVLLDTLTPQGTPLFPFTHGHRLSFKLCATGSAGEYLFLLLALGAAVFAFGDAFAGHLELIAAQIRRFAALF